MKAGFKLDFGKLEAKTTFYHTNGSGKLPDII